MDYPLVGVVDSIKFPGVDRIAGQREMHFCTMLSLREAMLRTWTDDALFLAYQVPGDTRWPRINSSAAAELERLGCPLLVTSWSIDYDNEDHAPWDADSWQRFEAKISELIESGFLPASQWTFFYSTPSGARFVYVLERALPLEESQARAATFVEQWRQAGLSIDPTCVEWSRLMRLPRTYRADRKLRTELAPFFTFEEQAVKLDPDLYPPSDLKLSLKHVAPIERDVECPDPETAYSLIYEGGKLTPWAAEAKRMLRGRECFSCIFEHSNIAEVGSRDVTVMRYAGQVVAMTFHLEGSTPAHAYALLLPAVEALTPDAGTPSWPGSLWRKIQRCWSQEEASARARQQQAVVLEAEAESFLDSVIDGIRSWTRPPAQVLGSDQAVARLWTSQHAIVAIAHNYYILGSNGRYIGKPIVNQAMLPSAIREAGMETVIPTTTITDSGVRDVDVRALLKRHGFMLSSTPTIVASQTAGGELIGDELRLGNPAYLRNPDLRAEFSMEVHEWLEHLFGDDLEAALEWIAFAQAIEDGPICALSLHGAPGSGKKMFASGLAECFSPVGKHCGGRAFTKFNSELLESPLIVIDEGFPTDRNLSSQSIPDAFRRLTSGDAMDVEAKFQPVVRVSIPFRILITANNENVASKLGDGLDLESADREAIRTRLLHLTCRGEASEWLRAKGGITYTARSGRRWIRGDAGQQSDYVVANHFRWLYEQRGPVRTGRRFLVEGSSSPEVNRLFEGSRGSPEVFEAVYSMVCSLQRALGQPKPGVACHAGSVWVTVHGVQLQIRSDLGAPRLATRAISSALRTLQTPDQPPGAIEIFDSALRENVRARWRRLDLDLLREYAERVGYVVNTIDAVQARLRSQA